VLTERSPISSKTGSGASEISSGRPLVTVQQAGREKRYTLAPEPLGGPVQGVKEVGELWERRLVRVKAFGEREER